MAASQRWFWEHSGRGWYIDAPIESIATRRRKIWREMKMHNAYFCHAHTFHSYLPLTPFPFFHFHTALRRPQKFHFSPVPISAAAMQRRYFSPLLGQQHFRWYWWWWLHAHFTLFDITIAMYRFSAGHAFQPLLYLSSLSLSRSQSAYMPFTPSRCFLSFILYCSSFYYLCCLFTGLADSGLLIFFFDMFQQSRISIYFLLFLDMFAQLL